MVMQPRSFIVRILYEDVNPQGKITQWHGSIERVGAEKRLYFWELESIADFIQEDCGIKSRGISRWRRWFRGFWQRIRYGN
jgi:hypothetical protein